MKLVSWNVNGIRAVLKKGFIESLHTLKADVVCLQETKAHPDQVDLLLPEYEYKFWNSAEKKGYAGTAIFSKIKPLSVTYDMGMEEHDTEGRVIVAEYSEFFLVNVYTPNAKRELLRLEYRQQWDKDFRAYLKRLDEKKPVIFCGDLNVAHKEIDIKNPTSNKRNPGFTDEERQGMTEHLGAGFIDSFRHFTDEPGHYTWWSYMFHARTRNIGWRIDYFCISNRIKDTLVSASIHPDIHGSDHCPVSVEIGE